MQKSKPLHRGRRSRSFVRGISSRLTLAYTRVTMSMCIMHNATVYSLRLLLLFRSHSRCRKGFNQTLQLCFQLQNSCLALLWSPRRYWVKILTRTEKKLLRDFYLFFSSLLSSLLLQLPLDLFFSLPTDTTNDKSSVTRYLLFFSLYWNMWITFIFLILFITLRIIACYLEFEYPAHLYSVKREN